MTLIYLFVYIIYIFDQVLNIFFYFIFPGHGVEPDEVYLDKMKKSLTGCSLKRNYCIIKKEMFGFTIIR